MKGNEAYSSPQTKPTNSGSEEGLQPTSWILGQENRFNFPTDIFLRRFGRFCISGFCRGDEEKVIHFMMCNRAADMEICLNSKSWVRSPML